MVRANDASNAHCDRANKQYDRGAGKDARIKAATDASHARSASQSGGWPSTRPSARSPSRAGGWPGTRPSARSPQRSRPTDQRYRTDSRPRQHSRNPRDYEERRTAPSQSWSVRHASALPGYARPSRAAHPAPSAEPARKWTHAGRDHMCRSFPVLNNREVDHARHTAWLANPKN